MRSQFEEIIMDRKEYAIKDKIAGFAKDWNLTPRRVSDWYYGQAVIRKHDIAAFIKYKNAEEMDKAIDAYFPKDNGQ